MSDLQKTCERMALEKYPENWVDCGDSGIKHDNNFSRRKFYNEALNDAYKVDLLKMSSKVQGLISALDKIANPERDGCKRYIWADIAKHALKDFNG